MQVTSALGSAGTRGSRDISGHALLFRATSLALVILLAVGGAAGTAIFGVLYFGNRDNVYSVVDAERTATASFDAGRRQGEREARTQLDRCDVIVGGAANFRPDVSPGDKVSMTLQIRSSRLGTVYEVQSPLICTVADDLQSCARDLQYRDGQAYPVGCR